MWLQAGGLGEHLAVMGWGGPHWSLSLTEEMGVGGNLETDDPTSKDESILERPLQNQLLRSSPGTD